MSLSVTFSSYNPLIISIPLFASSFYSSHSLIHLTHLTSSHSLDSLHFISLHSFHFTSFYHPLHLYHSSHFTYSSLITYHSKVWLHQSTPTSPLLFVVMLMIWFIAYWLQLKAMPHFQQNIQIKSLCLMQPM